ncbi:uncharacterized protein LOC134531131 [Bacillus rossius redtenbacheri]|uniref:uncharacterized protein LOC134531131 n=1 Tax=Bacillus rossius redtenbacheri TaxID=93214 RepID=UPI002FDD4DA5
MAGRKKDPIWIHFVEEPTLSGKGLKATCKSCGKQLMGLVARMKKHIETCQKEETEEDHLCESESAQRSCRGNDSLAIVRKTGGQISSSTSQGPSMQTKRTHHNENNGDSEIKKKFHQTLVDTHLVKTNSNQKCILDEQVARYIYATNSPFRQVDHPEFKKMVSLLRPGYKPPTHVQIGGDLLDTLYTAEREKCATCLEGKTVCLSLDGWSNIHNDPIICVAVTASLGEVYLVDTIDTSGHSHTADYLVHVAKAAVAKCEREFKCLVRSIVTDNTGNVRKMRSDLEKEDLNFITYGCSAHLLNLLAKDLQVPNVKEHVVEIVKYFRNNHFAHAKYKQEGGQQLILPQDVRWNTTVDCLSAYIKYWPVLVKICEENRTAINDNIYRKVMNVVIKRNAEDMLRCLKPVAIALDKVQKDSSTISTAVDVWKSLKQSLEDENLNADSMEKFSSRYHQVLDGAHFLAYLVDPRFCGQHLTADERSEALSFANNRYKHIKSLFPIIIKFQAKSTPFHNFLFDENVISKVSPIDWWKMNINSDTTEVMDVIEPLLTATASSASVERIFSTFGLVQSTLRNRLGTEKAAKLVFLFKILNK